MRNRTGNSSPKTAPEAKYSATHNIYKHNIVNEIIMKVLINKENTPLSCVHIVFSVIKRREFGNKR